MDLSRAARRGGAARRAAPPHHLNLYLTVVITLGAAGLVGTVALTSWPAVVGHPLRWSLAFVALAAFVGELRPLSVPRGEQPAEAISSSTPFVLALVAVGGAGIALLAQVTASTVDDLRNRRGARKTAFNAGQYTLSVLTGRAVYSSIAGVPFLGEPTALTPRGLGALVVGGVAMVAVNRLLVGTVVSLAAQQPLRTVLTYEARFFLAAQAVMLCLGGVAAEMASRGPAFLALLVAPAVTVYLATAAGLRHVHQAYHDTLTGLGNRERLRADLRTALATPDHPGPGLVLLDLDHFKDINDALGHEVGDRLLAAVAERLTSVTGDRAHAHRLGGDEFAIVVPGDLLETEGLAYELLAALEEPVRVGELELLVRASAGVAVGPEHGTDAESLLKSADIAMYHAKVERDRISTYSTEYADHALDRFQLLSDLRTAVGDGEFHVVYQPQVDLQRRRTVAAEALLRWRHPTRGDVAPDTFIAIAEDSGLIAQLTEYVLDQALSDVARWRAAGHDVRMSVNLSARHLSDLGLPRRVYDALGRHHVPPSSLVLEVTETALLSDPARADVVITALRALGVGIAVDDYGTGHASLTYLKRLDVDELKVDRTFVSDMNRDPHTFIIVRSTIALARDLGLRVVAEGVEDEMTAQALRDLGCGLAQGFHLGRPEPATTIAARLETEKQAVPTTPTPNEASPCS